MAASTKTSTAVKGFGNITTEIVGDLEKIIKDEQAKIEGGVKKAVEAHANKVLATAQELVPVKTGALKNSLQVKLTHGGTRAVVKTSLPYSFLVHFGTEKLQGRPFLYQSAERHSSELKPAIEQAIKEGNSGDQGSNTGGDQQ